MADKKVKGAGDRFLPGSNIAKHREWRGLKDTWYDYTEWVKCSASWAASWPRARCASRAVC